KMTAEPSSETASSSRRRTGRQRTQPVLICVGSSDRLTPQMRVVALRSGVTIGRRGATENGSYLALDDATLSRRHARLTASSGVVQIEDLGSRNGTFVNGRRLSEPVKLADGALVFLGRHAFVFRRAVEAELDALAEEAAQPFGPVPSANPAMALLAR